MRGSLVTPHKSAYTCLLIAAISISASTQAAQTQDLWFTDDQDRIIATPLPVGKEFLNAPWPKQWEEDFRDRADYVIHSTRKSGGYGNTWFENEKRSYGWAMLSILGGYKEQGLKFLQSEDACAQKWNKHTLGIDYFPCFTLKHQIRKYFYFGDYLDPAYKKRMKDAAAIFTKDDPLRKPHYAYTGEGVWGPDGKNSWVDVRGTDNLKLMRDTSVYLLAEETQNEQTRLLYKDRIRDFVLALYYGGMGEWESENYLGHSISPLLSLYDFAKDGEVKMLAKAALDWMCASGAVKYWRGGFNGPTRRDYNHPYPFGGSAPAMLWMWFGDSPIRPQEFESDEIHVITSAYRPPRAVVQLAHKNFSRPAELVACKVPYSPWNDPLGLEPEYRETHYFGHAFQFGTLARGTQDPDVNGFKILVFSSKLGAETIIAGPVSDPTHLGSPKYEKGLLAEHSCVGQNRNIAIYLSEQSPHPYLWLVPDTAHVVHNGDMIFVRCEKTYMAIWPINMDIAGVDKELTETVHTNKKYNKKLEKYEYSPRWPDSKVIKAAARGEGLYGFAIEIGEDQTHGSFRQFRTKASKIKPDTEHLDNGLVGLEGINGNAIEVQFATSLGDIVIRRDGRKRNWDSPTEKVTFGPCNSTDPRIITQNWHGGTLRVSAGGEDFTCTVTENGEVSFK
mgnify:CR=1 FL=1